MATKIPTRTIEDLAEDGLVDGAYGQYNDDKKLVVYNGYGSDDDNIAIVSAYCEKMGYDWYFNDSVVIDYNNGMAYTDEGDVVAIDGELLGRKGFEDEDYDFTTIEDKFVDNPTRALPSWFSEDDIISNGFTKLTCEFNNGLYEHNTNDDPQEIIDKLNEVSVTDIEVVFQIDFTNQFEMGFCAWVRGC